MADKRDGMFKPAAASGSASPIDAAQAREGDERMVTCVFPEPVLLTLDDSRRVRFGAGVREVPEHLAGVAPDGLDMHWYLRAKGVKRHGSTVTTVAIKGSTALPAVVKLGRGRTVNQVDLAESARKRLEMTVDEWNSLDDVDIEKEMTAEIDALSAKK